MNPREERNNREVKMQRSRSHVTHVQTKRKAAKRSRKGVDVQRRLLQKLETVRGGQVEFSELDHITSGLAHGQDTVIESGQAVRWRSAVTLAASGVTCESR